MRYLHTMVRVTDLDASLHFYRDLLGLVETRRMDNDKGRYTLVFLAAPKDQGRAETELLQEGAPLPPAEPWASMPNPGTW